MLSLDGQKAWWPQTVGNSQQSRPLRLSMGWIVIHIVWFHFVKSQFFQVRTDSKTKTSTNIEYFLQLLSLNSHVDKNVKISNPIEPICLKILG